MEAALRSSAAVTRELKKARAGATTGTVRDLRKALDAAIAATAELQEAAASYDLDEGAYPSSGAYTKELLALAAERGLSMVEEDDRLLCYPSLDQSGETATRKGRTLR